MSLERYLPITWFKVDEKICVVQEVPTVELTPRESIGVTNSPIAMCSSDGTVVATIVPETE